MSKVKHSYIPDKYDSFWNKMINKYDTRLVYLLNLQLNSGIQLLPRSNL